MKTFSLILVVITGAFGCGKTPASEPSSTEVSTKAAMPELATSSLSDVVIASAPGVPKPPFQFDQRDEALLEDIQRACFKYFWEAGHPVSGMIPDRTSKPTVSIAGVGFQLSAFVIGAERGWVKKEDAAQRARSILQTIRDHPDNRNFGLFYHFIDGEHAGQPRQAYEFVVSTIDSALFLAGALTASAYFGGETAIIADELFREANWSAFVSHDSKNEYERGFVSLAWKPLDISKPRGEGEFADYYWLDSGDEHRLVTFLGICAPEEHHRLDPALYYKLRRQIGKHTSGDTMVWFPYSGALFVSFFAHCWMDYSGMGVDDPSRFRVGNRPKVDWWENARRTTLMHRQKAIENPRKLPTLSENAWGLSASDTRSGYAVPGLFPTMLPMPGAKPNYDFALFFPNDNYGDGTIAPYAAGSAIMFTPRESIAALRYYRNLKAADGSPLVWREPASGGYGFKDSFNLGGSSSAWVAEDYVSIDQGPLLLAIENARSGLIWRVFHSHPVVQSGMERVGLKIAR